MARSRQRSRIKAPQTAKPRSDIYTGLLVVSLLAQIVGAVFLYFDYDRFKNSSPPIVKADLQPAGGSPGPAAQPNPPAAPAAPQPNPPAAPAAPAAPAPG